MPLRMNAALRRDLIYVFNKPNLISTDDRWINLFCGLGVDPHHEYGLMFLDDWDGQKIAVLVGVPLIVSILTAILWIASTGDIQNAMAVSSYILSATGGLFSKFPSRYVGANIPAFDSCCWAAGRTRYNRKLAGCVWIWPEIRSRYLTLRTFAPVLRPSVSQISAFF